MPVWQFLNFYKRKEFPDKEKAKMLYRIVREQMTHEEDVSDTSIIWDRFS